MACCKKKFLSISNIPSFSSGSPNFPDHHPQWPLLWQDLPIVFIVNLFSSWICMEYLPLHVKQPTINQSFFNESYEIWGLNSLQLRISTVSIRSSLVSLICCPSIKPGIINMFFWLCIKCLSIIWNSMFFSALMQEILLFGIIFGQFSGFFALHSKFVFALASTDKSYKSVSLMNYQIVKTK